MWKLWQVLMFLIILFNWSFGIFWADRMFKNGKKHEGEQMENIFFINAINLVLMLIIFT
jgi:hypothetical protein